MKGRKVNRAAGGKVMDAGGNPKVLEEVKERKKGGRVKSEKSAGEMKGGLSRHRLDRPGRKRGGRVGADMAPLSSAHNETSPGADD